VWLPTSTADVRRAVNLKASSELLADARNAGLKLSELFERALIEELRQWRMRQWREESTDAVAAYNEQLTVHGACFQGHWGE
jgi:antitoxin CcdA